MCHSRAVILAAQFGYDGTASKPITFAVKLDASIPPGVEVQITARAYGWGHPAPDCNGFVLTFSLTMT